MIRDWTVLVYMNSNNNLSEGLKGCLKHQLADLEPSDRVTIAVESSHLPQPNCLSQDRVEHARSVVANKRLEQVERLPYANMASPQTLEDFLKWGIKKYPAKQYMVVLQGHTTAWACGLPDDASRVDSLGRPAPPVGSLPYGGDGNSSARLAAPQLRKAFENVEQDLGVVPGVIAFDSCLAASAELLDELKGRAGIVIASADRMFSPSSGASDSLDYAVPLKPIFQEMSDRLASGQEVTPEVCAADWVKASRKSWTTPTLSAFRTSQSAAMRESLERMAEQLIKLPKEALLKALGRTRHYGGPQADPRYDLNRHLYDVGDLLNQILAEPELNSAHEAARQSREQFHAYRLEHQAQSKIKRIHRYTYSEEYKGTEVYPADRTSGLNVWLPSNLEVIKFQNQLGRDYGEMGFAQGPWSALIDHLCHS